jgi:hypothetical protein
LTGVSPFSNVDLTKEIDGSVMMMMMMMMMALLYLLWLIFFAPNKVIAIVHVLI